jgi:hypothetical protein
VALPYSNPLHKIFPENFKAMTHFLTLLETSYSTEYLHCDSMLFYQTAVKEVEFKCFNKIPHTHNVLQVPAAKMINREGMRK